MLSGVTPIEFNKGDYFAYKIKFPTARQFAAATNIRFVSHGLGLDKEFSKSQELKLFYLEFSANETAELKLGEYTFDIVVEFEEDKPISQCGVSITVLRRKNIDAEVC